MSAESDTKQMAIKISVDPSEIDREAWFDFVRFHDHGNIFQTHFMYEVYQGTAHYEPVVVAAIHEERIVGLLLAVIQSEASNVLGAFTARSIIWGGPLIAPGYEHCYSKLLSIYDQEVEGKAIYTQIRNLWDTSLHKESIEALGYEYDEHLNILIDLRSGMEELWKGLKSTGRKNIQKARKEGVVTRLMTDKAEVLESLDLIKAVYAKIKLPFPDDSFFEAMHDVLYPRGLILYFGAFFQDRLVGTRYVLCFNGMIYDWYAGSDDDFLDKRPNDILPWEVLQWGRENRFEIFDFGGAGKPGVPYGVRDYKLKFGGELVNYGRYMKIYKPRLFRLGKVGLRYWKRVRAPRNSMSSE